MARVTEQTKELHRTRLLEAAAAEFAQSGVDAANVNGISLSAGLAKGTVYNYFPSKEALFLAVVEQACTRAAQRAEPVAPDAPTKDRLRAILAGDIEWAREDEDFARVLVREALRADPRFYPRIIAAAAPFVEKVAEILGEGVERGEVRGDMPVERLALIFTGLGELALLQHWGTGGGWPALDEIPDLITGLFLDGAARAPEAKPEGRRRR
jgi:AcrR family transcriptional regulator